MFASTRWAFLALLATTAACVHSYDTVVLTNPVKESRQDDAAPLETRADPALDFEGPNGTENHSDLRYRFDVAAFNNDAERADAERLFPSHAAHLR